MSQRLEPDYIYLPFYKNAGANLSWIKIKNPYQALAKERDALLREKK